MSSTSDTNKNSRAEFALADSIDHVCRFLKLEDLYYTAQVCRSWCRDVLQEIKKRGPEIGCIPNLPLKNKNGNFESYISDTSNSKPHVTLLFIDSEWYDLTEANIKDVVSYYKEVFQSRIIVIRSCEVWFNSRALHSEHIPMTMWMKNCTPSLFLPTYQMSKLRISYCTKEENLSTNAIAERMFGELISADNSKIILIMFASSYNGSQIAKQISEIVEQRLEQQRYNIWGSESCLIEILEDANTGCQQPIFFGLTVSSPSIESWSFVTDNFVKQSEFDQQLLDFRKGIKLKRHSLGLVFGPAHIPDEENIFNTLEDNLYDQIYQNSFEYMNTINSIFPNIPFIGAFNYGYENIYGTQSTVPRVCICSMAVSLMIITYD